MSDQAHLQATKRYRKQHRGLSDMDKLAGVVGMSSGASVFGPVGRPSEAGYLERVDRRVVPGKRFFARHFVGRVRAGIPQTASQEAPEVFTVDDYLIDQPDRTTLHRVHGDSMHDAHIVDGELVVVEHNTPTKTGDIAPAVIDDELTAKMLALETSGRYFLEPANPACAHIHPTTSLKIMGVVASVMRRVRR